MSTVPESLPRITYVVLAHTHPEQLARMVGALSYENVRFLIHIERNAAIAPFLASVPPSPAVEYIKPREDGHWGGSGIVRATLHGVRAALSSEGGPPPDFVGLVSGLDYPVQTPLRISQFLIEQKGKSFIEYRPLPVPSLRNGGLDRVICYSVTWRRRRYTYYPHHLQPGFNWRGRFLNRLLGLLLLHRGPRRHPPYATPHFGSQWWMLSAEAAQAVIRFVDRHPDFLSYHEDSLLPDELFFQTILTSPDNAHLRNGLVNQNLHYIRWPEGSSSPAVLGLGDLGVIAESGRLLARKFDSSVNHEVLDRLDESLCPRGAAVVSGGPDPVLSVRLITYMQEGFIRQALDGILSQRADFPFELVIGEDAGADRTRAICEEYVERHPATIRLLPWAPRRGMVANHLETLRACRGEFVALCDGDDYWVDPEKLQLQVDILRRKPDCNLSFHNALAEYPNGERHLWMEGEYPQQYGAKDLFNRWLITTSSMVFRNPRMESYPRFMKIATHEDLALMVLLAHHGNIEYLDRTMCVYRRHPQSVMASFKGISFMTRQIEFLRETDRWSNGRYAATINRRVAGLRRSRAVSWASMGERRVALREMAAAIRLSTIPAGPVVTDCARLALELCGLGSLARTVETEQESDGLARGRP